MDNLEEDIDTLAHALANARVERERLQRAWEASQRRVVELRLRLAEMKKAEATVRQE